jgi:crossover junction endodeoxyribonuclease RuvC
MKILGVDPGLRTSGYAVIIQQGHDLRVLDAGTLKADEQLPLAQRLQQIYSDIDTLLVEHAPDLIAVEELYSHYQHPRTAILMAHARAVFLLAAARNDISVHGFSATRIKKSITGNGRASKQQMQKAVQTQLSLAKIPTPADVADALAVAMCCLNEHNRESVLL